MNSRELMDSFNFAIEGLMYVCKTQRNMRRHMLMAVGAVLLGIYFDLTKTELLLLFLAITLVLVAEMVNTGIELIIDLITKEFHPLARIIKDICAGAVLIASLNAVFLGYILFVSMIPAHSVQTSFDLIRSNPLHVTTIALTVVLVSVITAKLKIGRGRPLRGGMPSGHSAIAFSLWAASIFLTQSKLLIFAMLLLAILVGQSRIRPGYHSLREVIAGAFVGTGLTTLVFWLIHR